MGDSCQRSFAQYHKTKSFESEQKDGSLSARNKKRTIAPAGWDNHRKLRGNHQEDVENKMDKEWAKVQVQETRGWSRQAQSRQGRVETKDDDNGIEAMELKQWNWNQTMTLFGINCAQSFGGATRRNVRRVVLWRIDLNEGPTKERVTLWMEAGCGLGGRLVLLINQPDQVLFSGQIPILRFASWRWRAVHMFDQSNHLFGPNGWLAGGVVTYKSLL